MRLLEYSLPLTGLSFKGPSSSALAPTQPPQSAGFSPHRLNGKRARIQACCGAVIVHYPPLTAAPLRRALIALDLKRNLPSVARVAPISNK